MSIDYYPSLREAAYVRQIAATVGGGGSRQLVPMLATTVQEQRRKQIARVETPDQAARAYRVTLGEPEFLPGLNQQIPQSTYTATPPTGFPTTSPNVDLTRVSVTAELVWGVGGARHRALLDWRQGTSFVVHGSNVTLSVLSPNGVNVPALPTGSTGEIAFIGMIVPNDSHVPNVAPPSLTFDTGSIAISPAASTMPIPPYARAVRIHRYAGTDNFTVMASADAANTLIHSQLSYGPGQPGNITVPFALPANARWLTIRNDSGATTESFLLEFLLDLG